MMEYYSEYFWQGVLLTGVKNTPSIPNPAPHFTYQSKLEDWQNFDFDWSVSAVTRNRQLLVVIHTVTGAMVKKHQTSTS